MSRLTQHAQMSLAIRMIEFGLRTSIVQLHTGISPPILRSLYREVHNGAAPSSGQIPDAESIVRTRSDMLDASLFLNLYTKVGGPAVYRAIDIDAMMRAYSLFLELLRPEAGFEKAPRIGASEAWVLTRDLRGRSLEMRPCQCGCTYVVVAHQRLLPRCPVCGAANDTGTSSSIRSTGIGLAISHALRPSDTLSAAVSQSDIQRS